MKKTVITVIGKDNFGIIAKTSAICAECNVNIVDITQSVLGDMFVMVMLADISAANCSFTRIFSIQCTGYKEVCL